MELQINRGELLLATKFDSFTLHDSVQILYMCEIIIMLSLAMLHFEEELLTGRAVWMPTDFFYGA